jgi:hypothetical protein
MRRAAPARNPFGSQGRQRIVFRAGTVKPWALISLGSLKAFAFSFLILGLAFGERTKNESDRIGAEIEALPGREAA